MISKEAERLIDMAFKSLEEARGQLDVDIKFIVGLLNGADTRKAMWAMDDAMDLIREL